MVKKMKKWRSHTCFLSRLFSDGWFWSRGRFVILQMCRKRKNENRNRRLVHGENMRVQSKTNSTRQARQVWGNKYTRVERMTGIWARRAPAWWGRKFMMLIFRHVKDRKSIWMILWFVASWRQRKNIKDLEFMLLSHMGRNFSLRHWIAVEMHLASGVDRWINDHAPFPSVFTIAALDKATRRSIGGRMPRWRLEFPDQSLAD